jgi:hypothetical protein
LARCPWCGNNNAYIGLKEVECSEPDCPAYIPDTRRRKARVVWGVNGSSGHTRWLTLEEAKERAKKGNDTYGAGTHWVEDGDLEWVFDV